MSNNKFKTIIINNTYAGDYGFDKNNLPHEMINFFRADDGNFYVYITPYGVLNDKIKKDNITAILFARSVGNGLVEVLAKAEIGAESYFYTEGLQLFGENKQNPEKSRTIKSIYCKNDINKKEKLTKTINELSIAAQKITYGDVNLETIHKANVHDNNIYLSLRVDKICLPKKTFYLAYKQSTESFISEDIFIIKENKTNLGKKINNQSMLSYYYNCENGNTKDSYDKLKKIIENNELWKDANETPKFDSKNIADYYNDLENFFKITRQQDNEVMFSNMFYYYFSEYPELLNKFAEEVLNKHLDADNEITLNKKHIVEREKERMDVRIIDDNYYIIIENKLKSGINGMHKEKGSDDFDDHNGKYISQLSVYYQKAEDKNHQDDKQRKILPFIFVPDYSIINENYLNKFDFGDKYKIIYYSEIRSFFEKYINKFSVKPNYIDDFVKALKKHTEKTDDEHRKILMFRLKNRVDKNK